jgi:uncharacterized protein YqgV (UPF0045/DUF77 family)
MFMSIICAILLSINTFEATELRKTSKSFFSLRNDTLGLFPFSPPAPQEAKKIQPKEKKDKKSEERKVHQKIKRPTKKRSVPPISKKDKKEGGRKNLKSPLFLKIDEKTSPPFQPFQGLSKGTLPTIKSSNPKREPTEGNIVGLTASILSAILILLGIGYFLRKRTFAKREDDSFRLYAEDLMYKGKVEESIRELREVHQKLLRDLEFRVNKEKTILEAKIQELKKVIGQLDEKLKVLDSSTPRISPKPQKKEKTLHSKIYKLWDEGLSIEDIAKKTNKGKGEVELILGLRGERTIEER